MLFRANITTNEFLMSISQKHSKASELIWLKMARKLMAVQSNNQQGLVSTAYLYLNILKDPVIIKQLRYTMARERPLICQYEIKLYFNGATSYIP